MTAVEAIPSADYRAYIVDREGHFSDVRTIRATTDKKAWKAARGLKLGTRIELWCRDREVLRRAHKRARPIQHSGHGRAASQQTPSLEGGVALTSPARISALLR